MTNLDIAARIDGYIRQAETIDAFVPSDPQKGRTMQTLLAPKMVPNTTAVAAENRRPNHWNLIVDRAALDDPDLV